MTTHPLTPAQRAEVADLARRLNSGRPCPYCGGKMSTECARAERRGVPCGA